MPGRHRRHIFKSSFTALPLRIDDSNDSNAKDEMDEDKHWIDSSSTKLTIPLPPVLESHPPPNCDDISASLGHLRAVGFPDAKAQRTGLQAKDGVRASGSVVLARRLSGKRWRAHPSDYDEVVAQAHLYKPSVPPTHTGKRRVAAYITSEQIELYKVQKWMKDMIAKDFRRAETIETNQNERATSNFLVNWQGTMYLEVLHLSSMSKKSAVVDDDNPSMTAALREKHMFVFETGCCVFWGLTREEEARYLTLLAPFSSSVLRKIDAQVMEFSYGDRSSIAKDAIILCTNGVAEKIALSFAMAQSATLSAFETRVGDRIRSSKHIPSSLASVGSIRYSHNDTSKLIGEIFIELADVNIHSNVLDEPNYFLKSQDNEDFKYLYEKMLKYQDVANRVAILNKRLSILRDLVNVLNQQLTHHQGSKLEWIIIWMLVFQVIIAIGWEIFLKDILGYFHHG